MEPEYWDKNPFKATTKAFPSGFHFKPTAINKTRTFYEFFSIDSNSISIKYLKDPNDPLLKTHSTIQILKVLQPRQFGPNLHEIKIFSVPLDPRGYTYWDYMDAWTKVFWHQNKKYKIRDSFTSRLTHSIIFQIGSFSGGNFLVQFQKYSRNRFNMDLLNSTKCLILKNRKFA